MIEVSLLNNSQMIAFPVTKIMSSFDTNSIYFYFNNDDEARSNERVLKTFGCTTQHSDSAIRVFDINSYDMIIN